MEGENQHWYINRCSVIWNIMWSFLLSSCFACWLCSPQTAALTSLSIINEVAFCLQFVWNPPPPFHPAPPTLPLVGWTTHLANHSAEHLMTLFIVWILLTWWSKWSWLSLAFIPLRDNSYREDLFYFFIFLENISFLFESSRILVWNIPER